MNALNVFNFIPTVKQNPKSCDPGSNRKLQQAGCFLGLGAQPLLGSWWGDTVVFLVHSIGGCCSPGLEAWRC